MQEKSGPLRVTFVERDLFYSEFDHLAQEFCEKPTNQADKGFANN